MSVRPLDLPMLTDDELVAIATRLPTAWRTPLPTVDLADHDAAMAALLRGARSLYVRGLLDVDTDTLEPTLAAHLTDLGSRPLAVGVFAADVDGEPLRGRPVQYFFAHPAETHWMCDSVSAGGVHTFSVDDATNVHQDALRAVRAVTAAGVQDGTPGTTRLAVVSQHGDQVRVLHVTQGTLTAALIRADGDTATTPAPATPEEALAWLWS